MLTTTPSRAPAVLDHVAARHPYEVPELLVVEVAGGYAPYLAWVEAAVAGGDAAARGPGPGAEPAPGGAGIPGASGPADPDTPGDSA